MTWTIPSDRYTSFRLLQFQIPKRGKYNKRESFCVFICIFHIFLLFLWKVFARCIVDDMCSEWVPSIWNDKNSENSKHYNSILYILLQMLSFVCISKIAIYIRLKFIGWYMRCCRFPRRKEKTSIDWDCKWNHAVEKWIPTECSSCLYVS